MAIIITQNLINEIKSIIGIHELPTWLIAREQGCSTKNTREMLKAMEKIRIVKRSKLSRCNNIVWGLTSNN